MSRMKKLPFLPVFLSVPLIANLIAVAASFVLNDLIFLKEERERFQLFTAAVPWAMGLINFFPFSAAAAGVLFYLYPLIKELRSFKEKGILSESSAGILLNAPIAVSLIALAGWFLGTATAVSLQIYYIKNVTLRGFTSLSEKLSPSQIVEMLNIHFETMSRCIEEEGGLINKFIGDAIMAIYNVPIPRENHTERAYTSAKRMLSSLDLMNEDFIRKGLPELKIGIGIHTGEVLAGNIGSSSRMEYTVIGDAVNVSSRIESMCKETKRSLLVSEAARLRLPNTVNLDLLGEFHLKGRKELIKLYG